MIDLGLVQKQIIALAKADAALVALVNDDIREESWMGKTHNYPNVRVDLSELQPASVDGCVLYRCRFNVAYRAAGTSSVGCLRGMTAVIEAYEDKGLTEAGEFVSHGLVQFMNLAGPVPEAVDEWMGRLFFQATLKEV